MKKSRLRVYEPKETILFFKPNIFFYLVCSIHYLVQARPVDTPSNFRRSSSRSYILKMTNEWVKFTKRTRSFNKINNK